MTSRIENYIKNKNKCEQYQRKLLNRVVGNGKFDCVKLDNHENRPRIVKMGENTLEFNANDAEHTSAESIQFDENFS